MAFMNIRGVFSNVFCINYRCFIRLTALGLIRQQMLARSSVKINVTW